MGHYKKLRTPLTIAVKIVGAAERNAFDTVLLLLDENASLDLKDALDAARSPNNGHTAVMWAAFYGYGAYETDGLKHIFEYYGIESQETTRRKADIALDRLISIGADPNLTDYYGQTALHVAAERGTGDAITRLIGAHAGIDTRDGDEMTPLMCAACYNRIGGVRRLLSAEANPLLRSYDETALQLLHQSKLTREQKDSCAALLVPAMFDQKWWTGKPAAEINATWNELPPEWKKYGVEAISKLSRQFNPSRASVLNRRCKPARLSL